MKSEPPKITVAIRKRPLNKKQQQKNQTDIIRVDENGSVSVNQIKQKVDLTKYIEQTIFNFDFAFNENSTNQQIYEACIRPLIDSAFMGAKVSCFAYGQTGSGKTYTMKGDMEKGVPGLYYLGAKEIFRYLDHPNFQNLQIYVSFFEIYCGKLYDLLNNRYELKIMQDKKNNINVIGMEEKYICSAEEFLDVIEYGSTYRVTSQNATNADSSRSHAILQIIIKDGKKTFTKISFIDLAGNERGADHMDQNKQTKIDGAQINKSLLALKQCIRALDQGKGHTPFRGSKLTMVLKDSFVGFCKTVMIGNVSPNVTSAENTMNTLRYADRVKELKNAGDTPLSKQQQAAREMMLPRANKNSIKVNISRDDDNEDIEAKKQLARKKINKSSQNQKNDGALSDMDIEQAPRRKTEILPIHKDIVIKNEIQRKSVNPILSKNNYEYQDENNPKQKHFNFPANSQPKHIDMKPQTKLLAPEHQENQPTKNSRPYGFPRTENSHGNHGHHNGHHHGHHHHHNSHNVHGNYRRLAEEVQNLKQQFLIDHLEALREEGLIVREQGEQYDMIARSNIDELELHMQNIQRKINRKMEIFANLKKKADFLASRVAETKDASQMITDSQAYDEQLLEGLPIDDFGGKLF